MMQKRLANIPTRYRKLVRNELDELARVIKEARSSQGITQEALAADLDLAITTIQAIENGRRFPSLPTLLYICRKLGIQTQFKRSKN